MRENFPMRAEVHSAVTECAQTSGRFSPTQIPEWVTPGILPARGQLFTSYSLQLHLLFKCPVLTFSKGSEEMQTMLSTQWGQK